MRVVSAPRGLMAARAGLGHVARPVRRLPLRPGRLGGVPGCAWRPGAAAFSAQAEASTVADPAEAQVASWARARDVPWVPSPLDTPEELSRLAGRVAEATTPSEHLTRADAITYLGYCGLKNAFFTLSGALAATSSGLDLGGMATQRLRTRTFQSMAELFLAELEDIRAGDIKMPWDIALAHRQNNPFHVLDQTARLVRVARETIERRQRKGEREVLDTSVEDVSESNPTAPKYPSYYLRNYHFQSDGWMSAKSAAVYDHQAETLFTGSQDAMQRQSLVPLAHFVRERAAEGVGEDALTLVDVACGTGRFLSFARDQFPTMRTAALELSPFYLAQARENIEYWADFTHPPASPSQRQVPPTQFLHANAEELPLGDASVDAVSSVYLFHELPEEARENVAREVARVLKPGGIFILNDSVQKGDRPYLDEAAISQGFTERFNEVHYDSYFTCDLVALCGAHGLELESRRVVHATKVISFRKKA